MRRLVCSSIAAALLGTSAIAGPIVAQATPRGHAAPRTPTVAVLDAVLYTAGANVQEASDTGKAELVTQVIRRVLRDSLGPSLIDSAAVARAEHAPEATAITGGKPCGAILACAREVGRKVGASWVVMSKISKTSNLIWLLTGQLVDVSSGKIVLDDSTELKGEPDRMIQAGARIFADRVARTVRQRSAHP
jgi:hypothetical protein